MEHVNATTSSMRQHQHLQQQQQQQQSQHQHHHNQHQQQQQQQHDNQQQFCLRWHNHQTSLLSTLPILLDQSHLTDVTLSAEGRTLRAHRVVLSACSTFFLELFRALDTSNHPVIIIPGASFAAIVALLTFMYSGEVNVFEEQIPTLLNLAETLGIKGLADVQNNLQKSAKQKQTDYPEQVRKAEVDTPPTPTTPTDFVSQQQSDNPTSTLLSPAPSLAGTVPTLTTPTQCNKTPTPLESLFIKSLQFYPNLLPQPLNFSQSALNKTSELLAKYQQHCNLYQSALGNITGKDFLLTPSQMQTDEPTTLNNEETYNTKRLCTVEKKQQLQQQSQQQQQQQQQSPPQLHQQQQKDIKRIDKIVENLRCSNKTQSNDSILSVTQHQQQQQQNYQQQQQQFQLKTSIANFAQSMSPNLTTKPPMFASATSQLQQQQQQQQQQPITPHSFMSPEEQIKFQQQLEHFANCSRDIVAAANRNTPENSCQKTETNLLTMSEKLPTPTPSSPQVKTPSNSKLYATCFICHKQLSNQYNLRVHLETHQNVRYACNVCSHVSRSKDALRKHVSYRHPGAPSPCESEARRKRAKTLNIPTSSIATSTIIGTSPPSPSSAPTTPFQLGNLGAGAANLSNINDTAETTVQLPTTAATMNSAAYMFLPNQFHLAAAAAAAATGNLTSTPQQPFQIKTSTVASNIISTPVISSIATTTPIMSLPACDVGVTATATTTANLMPTKNSITTATTTTTSDLMLTTTTKISNDLNAATLANFKTEQQSSPDLSNMNSPNATTVTSNENLGNVMSTP